PPGGGTDVARHASVRASGTARDVVLPPLRAGQHLFPRFALHQHPPDADWRETAYRAATPWVVTFDEVTVFGDAGLILAGNEIVADTAGRADPARDRFHRDGAGITLYPAGPVRRIEGSCLSLLGVGAESIYHWTIDGIGRLAAAAPADLAEVTDLLLPAGLGPVQQDLLARAGLPGNWRRHWVGPGEAIAVARLVLPWSIESDFSVGGNHRPHPCIAPYFARFATGTPAGPRRIYIDRRASPNRRLQNEDEVVAALAGFGCVPVRLEDLSGAEQIGLFANAEVVVAPHGAGLAHLVHARPGAALLELHATHWVNWCYRRHAAVLGLIYDAIPGPPMGGRDGDHVNTRPWSVPVLHLRAALDGLLTA
ncbi:MAG: glycosyltransferase family 61 protein, partial [Alphaproteobacteria bacterium]|nr:glycosyltransferase family 61 protein [Alphaproteobacteria bacterium]